MKMATANPTATTAMPTAINICVLSGAAAVAGGEVVAGGDVVGLLNTPTVIPSSSLI